MIVGFKTGPRNFAEGKQIVEQHGATMCELWFNVDEASMYEDMFTWLRYRGVSIGLHHWGLVQGRYKTNLMTRDTEIYATTIAQVRKTLDIAADIEAVYVNIHPGAEAIEEMSFSTGEQRLVPEKPRTETKDAVSQLLAGAQELTEYAKHKNMLLTFETLPAMEYTGNGAREDVYDSGNASLETVEALAKRGIAIANDITHTAACAAIVDPNPTAMWEHLLTFTKSVADKTHLLHINTVSPPYNGTDSHGGVTEEDFSQECFPSAEQIQQFLGLFRERSDVYALVEPRHSPIENYLALTKLADAS